MIELLGERESGSEPGRNGAGFSPAAVNAGQSDRDADGAGDACDASPDGPDTDGDGVFDRLDACPLVAGTEPNGCPPPPVVTPPVVSPPVVTPPVTRTPPVTADPPATSDPRPAVSRLVVRLSRCGARRACARTARASATTSGADVVRVRIERRRCDILGVCGWVKVTEAVRPAAATVALRLPRKLRRGTYRAVAVATAGTRASAPAVRRFSVR